MVYLKNVDGVDWKVFSISVMKGNKLRAALRQNE